jgi:subtilisin-like proprotein convertase family protein
LRWRDVQHIIVKSAVKLDHESSEWKVNGVGKSYHHNYGFGLITGERLIETTRKHKLVPESVSYTIETTPAIRFSGSFRDEININEDIILEHVVIKFSIDLPVRKSLVVTLISPSGTESTLIEGRPHDESPNGFSGWSVLTVFNWGENSRGNWTLNLHNTGDTEPYFTKWSITLYGIPCNETEWIEDKTGLHYCPDLRNNHFKQPPSIIGLLFGAALVCAIFLACFCRKKPSVRDFSIRRNFDLKEIVTSPKVPTSPFPNTPMSPKPTSPTKFLRAPYKLQHISKTNSGIRKSFPSSLDSLKKKPLDMGQLKSPSSLGQTFVLGLVPKHKARNIKELKSESSKSIDITDANDNNEGQDNEKLLKE